MSAGQALLLTTLTKRLHLEGARLAMATLELQLAMDGANNPISLDIARRTMDIVQRLPICLR